MGDLGELAARAAELSVRLVVAVAVVAAFVLVGRSTTPLVRRMLARRGRPSHTRVFGGSYRVAVVVVGSLFALTLAFPSVRVADVLAIFGIVSVAAGFAFKDTFENLLAGVLLLLRDPFQSGDQVVVAEQEGTVEGVTVRETLVRGHDGRRVLVPNAKVMTEVIVVATHEPALRQSFRLRLDLVADVDAAAEAITSALAGAAGVHDLPAPEVVVVDVVEGDLEVECRFWSGSRRREATAARSRAITTALGALRDVGVPLASDELRVTVADADADADAGGDGGRDRCERPRDG